MEDYKPKLNGDTSRVFRGEGEWGVAVLAPPLVHKCKWPPSVISIIVIIIVFIINIDVNIVIIITMRSSD